MLFEDYDNYEDEFLDEEIPTPKGFIFKILNIGILAAVATIGATFAANVNLGSSGQIEFGQGVLVAGACDSSITAAPTTTFKNDSVTAGFVFGGVKLSGISEKCKNKLFILTAYPETLTALNVNSDVPHKSLKFHFDTNGPVADMSGCLTFPGSITNSVDDNRIFASTSNCQWPDPYFDQHNVFANNVYKFTLETRINTIKKVLLKYTKGDGRTIGWVFDTGEEVHQSQFVAMTEYPMYLDTAKNTFYSIFLRLDNTEFASASSLASTFNFSAVNGTTCTYVGTTNPGDRSRAPGFATGWSQFQGLEWVCKSSQDDTLTIS